METRKTENDIAVERAIFFKLEAMYYKINGASAVPYRSNGNPDYGRAMAIASQKGDRMTNAALEYFYLRAGKPLAPITFEKNPIFPPPQIPDWSSTFGTLPGIQREQKTARDEIIERIDVQVDEKYAGKTIYTPVYTEHDNQITIEEEWSRQRVELQDELDHLNENINDPEKLHIVDKKGLVTGSFASVYKTPMSVPASDETNDTGEVGSTNINYIGSPTKGDTARIIAERGDYVYIVTEADLRGWVRKKDVAELTEAFAEYAENFYADGIPMQYTYNGSLHALRPGDSVYKKEGKLYSAESDAKGHLVFHELSELEPEKCVSQLSTPEEIINFLYKIRECYKWGDMDCAKIINRVLRMAGEKVPESASGIVDHFLHRQGVFDLSYKTLTEKQREVAYEQARHNHFLPIGGFDKLKPGIYYADMGPMKDGDYKPQHGVTIIVGENQEFEAHSMAFNIRDGQGEITLAVGPAVSDKAALEYYQRNLNWNFRVVQIAGNVLHPRTEYEAVQPQ